MLSDNEIEKRMVEALEEGGRHTIDDLAKSTGIDKERIGRALIALEQEELVAHITLEGTCRFYINAANIKDPPKKARKIPDKVPCPKCGELRSPAGMWKHVKYCKGKIVLKSVAVVSADTPLTTTQRLGGPITISTPPADYTITGPQVLVPIPMGVDAVLALVRTPNLFRILIPECCRMDIIGWRIRFDKDGPILESMQPESTLTIRREK